MTIYIKDVLVRLDSIPATNADVTLEVPEGTEISASITVSFGDGGGTFNLPVSTYTRVGQYITVKAPSGVGETGANLHIEQTSDFQDDATGNTVISVVATNTTAAGTNANVSADTSEAGKVKLTFDIPRGNTGATGTNGTNGTNGLNGKSAYEVAVAGGFVGTEAQWLVSLKGSNGTNGTNGAAGTNGVDGKSFNIRGDYSSTDTYNKFDVVNSNGASYVCKIDGTTGLTPGNWPLSFQLLAKDGEDGQNGTKGDKGTDGANAYMIAVATGFVGNEAEWIASLKGAKGDAGTISNLPYRDIAGGALWVIRPRMNISQESTGGYTYTKATLDTSFVVEDRMYVNSGVYVPTNAKPTPASPEFHIVSPSEPGAWGITGLTGRVDSSGGDLNAPRGDDYRGWYWAELNVDPATVPNLSAIEVQCNPIHANGYEQVEGGSNGTVTIKKGDYARGLVFPLYMGASKVNGKIRLWFRFLTYAYKAPTSGWSDNTNRGMWDGIGNDYDAWDLKVAEVHWWSTNVAQGVQFNARIRN